MLDLAFVTILVFVAAGVGLRLLRWLDVRPLVGSDALGLAVPLGLGAIGLAMLGLGEVGMLRPAGIAGVFLAGAVLGWREMLGVGERMVGGAHPTEIQLRADGCLQDLSPAASIARVPKTEPVAPGSARDFSGRFTTRVWSVDAVLLGLLGATVLGSQLAALAPVTDGDALCYHLQVPKVFLANRSVGFDPDLHETVYPLLTEMLYAAALGLRGPVACRLVQWVLGLVFALNVNALARPSLGRRAWWAGTIALLAPAVSNGMSAPLNDVALAAFATAALAAWARFDQDPSPNAAIVAGLLAGLALGVKYPALVAAGLIGIAIVASTLRRRSRFGAGFREGLRASIRFGSSYMATALLVGGAWYLRAALHTGNPVYPFFRQVFGGSGLDEVLDPIKRPLAPSAWNLVIALGPLTLQPGRFDSFSHQFGPVFLLALPALLLEKAPRRVLAIAAVGQAFLILCLTQRQSMRFLLFAIGPWSVASAWLVATWCDRKTRPARLLVGILLVALGFESSLAVARVRHGWNVVLGRETTEQFLARREPTFRVGRWIDGHLPPEARIVGQDHRGFYIPRPYSMELAHRRRTGLGRRGESASQLAEQLRRDGFTHVMLCPPVPETAVEFDPTLGRRLGPWLERHSPLYDERIADADGVVRRYAIYELADEPAIAARVREERQ